MYHSMWSALVMKKSWMHGSRCSLVQACRYVYMSLKTSCLTLLALLGKDALECFDSVGALFDDGLCMFDDELCCVVAL